MKQSAALHDQLKQVPDTVKREMELSCAIIDRIDILLKEKGMTRRELAARIGCNETQIVRWTKGFPNYTLQSIAKLESALGEPLIHAE